MNSLARRQASPDPAAGTGEWEAPEADPDLLRAALSAALDAIDRPALLVHPDGHAMIANVRGQEWLASSSTDLHTLLPTALSGSRAGRSFKVSLVRGRSGATSYLLVEQSGRGETERRIAAARTNWQLTRAEARVFERLGRGTSNKTIARDIGCSIRTVELHVSSILKKARARSRAELIAKLWAR